MLTTILHTGSVLPPGGRWRLSQTVSSLDKSDGQPAADVFFALFLRERRESVVSCYKVTRGSNWYSTTLKVTINGQKIL